MPLRQEFERELKILHKDLIKMGTIIEKSMDDAILALMTHDIALAKSVIERDDIIDTMEVNIEKDCLLLIARQQPLATDLRDIASVLKMITDLERIADNCSDICEYVLKLADEEYVKPLVHIPEMAEAVKKMVKDTIDSYVNQDLDLAKDVCKQDDNVDSYFNKLIGELTEIIQAKPSMTKQCINFIFIVKYLERIGDHSTNVAEWIIYTVTGEHI